jgi:glycosyltransferase involved in cell wall biosynthesis
VVLAHGAHAAFVSAVLVGGPPIIWHRILSTPDRGPIDPFRLAQRLLVRRIRGAIAITEQIGDQMRDLGFHGPVWQIPNHRPAPVPRSAQVERGESLRAELGHLPTTPIVSTIGHLVPQKDPCTAIDVFGAIASRHPDARFVVAGDGPLRAQAERRALERLPPGVVSFLGHRHDVPALLDASDVVLSTSRSDAMPGVVIEAQLAGCPVVAFPVDGVEQIVESGVSGFVTSSAEVEEAANAVCSIIADPRLRARMSGAARAGATRFTTEQAAPRYATVLATVAAVEAEGDPIRVLHVIPDLGVGGAEQALRVLASTIPLDDVTQVVAAIGGARRPLGETVHAALQSAGVGYCDLAIRRAPTRSVIALGLATRRLGRLTRQLKFDVVDAALLDASLPSRLVRSGATRVTHLVNTPYDDAVTRTSPRRAWRRKVLCAVDRFTARRDDALVALTAAVARASRAALGPSSDRKLAVIPRGVDVEAFAPLPNASAGDLVVSVGRLVPQKGHDTLIRAVAAARAGGCALHLSIVGEGPLEGELVDLAERLGVGDHVTLTGAVSDVRPLVAGGGVFGLASRWEGQSNAVLEAMAMGSAVVVADVPALREVVGDAGRLVPPDDVEAWCGVLVELAGDPQERRRLGEAARARVLAEYDARDRSAELVGLYRSLTLDRRRGRRRRYQSRGMPEV